MNPQSEKSLEEVVCTSFVRVVQGRFAMIKVVELAVPTDCFLVTRDEDEVTAVIEEKMLATVNYLDIQKWFKLIEIVVSVPFFTVGFIASVTTSLAQKGLNVLVISTFSKDYFMVREQKIAVATESLRELGFPISSG